VSRAHLIILQIEQYNTHFAKVTGEPGTIVKARLEFNQGPFHLRLISSLAKILDVILLIQGFFT
jgi:hypothetical protein